jgi:ABC-type multidrug transport system ATPase subunit
MTAVETLFLNGNSMIEVRDLVKMYGTLAAVDHISFDVPKGAILGLLGPNGAGKSTTMKILTTALPPTMGKVSIAGFDVVLNSHGSTSPYRVSSRKSRRSILT